MQHQFVKWKNQLFFTSYAVVFMSLIIFCLNDTLKSTFMSPRAAHRIYIARLCCSVKFVMILISKEMKALYCCWYRRWRLFRRVKRKMKIKKRLRDNIRQSHAAFASFLFILLSSNVQLSNKSQFHLFLFPYSSFHHRTRNTRQFSLSLFHPHSLWFTLIISYTTCMCWKEKEQ